jgi:NOL1/NOP2/fmu family ribosome biogenesis protein
MTPACSTAGGSTPTRLVQWDSSWPAFVFEPQRNAVLGYFDMRFGIPLITFDGFCLLLRHKTYSLLSATPHVERLAGLQVHSVGLPVLRGIRHHLKPTTAALQYFGTEARRHVLDLSETQVVTLLRDREQPLHLDIQPGYVILCHAGHILGCGLYTPGRLRSQLPQHPVVSL